MLLAMGIRLVLSFIKGALKNPKSADEGKTALLELRNAINELYPGE